MNREEMIDTIRTLLRTKDKKAIDTLLHRISMADLVDALSALDVTDIARFWMLLPKTFQPEFFTYFEAPTQDALLHKLPRPTIVALFEQLPADNRADIYKRMDEPAREKLLPALAKAERDDILNLAAFEEGTVGSITTSDYATVRKDMTVAEALQELRAAAPDKETIYVIYVLDELRRLVGVLSLRELVLATEQTRVADLMHHEPIFAQVDWPREEAARLIARHDLLALPVVDSENQMVGIVTVDDAMDVSQDESTEDFHKAGGMGALKGVSVKTASVFHLYRKRVFWLLILVFGNLFSGAGIAHYEETIAAYIALVFFLPLLVDSGGNAGSQSATLMIRAMATGDVVMKDWIKMLGREFATAGILGLTMAVAVSSISFFRGGSEVAVVVALSMVMIVILGSVIGMSLPFVLARFKLDPATASAPLVTSISDAAGILIYLSIATAMLGTSPAG
jgi:magnesium transporter